MKFSIKCLWK